LAGRHRHRVRVVVERADISRRARAKHLGRPDRHGRPEIADEDLADVQVDRLRRRILNRHLQANAPRRDFEHGSRVRPVAPVE
jgi:hypothetical protein